MPTHSIPVDPTNLGQVLACIGFLEASQILCGRTEGGFEWDKGAVRFFLTGEVNPFERVLEFVATSKIQVCVPPNTDYVDLGFGDSVKLRTYPSKEFKELTPVVQLAGSNHQVQISHWIDGSSRDSFKLFAGTQKTHHILRNMIDGDSSKGQTGIRDFWAKNKTMLVADPFNVTTRIGGSFNFDPRGSWTAINAGYSPNDQGHGSSSSPVVEVMAAWGLEHARPSEFGVRQVRYAIWKGLLPVTLARPAFGNAEIGLEKRVFRLELDLAGKNKIVTYATEEKV